MVENIEDTLEKEEGSKYRYVKLPADIRKLMRYIEKRYDMSLNEYDRLTANGCWVCGWKYLIDIHEHPSRKNCQKFVALCPNHHMLVHRRGVSLSKLKTYEADYDTLLVKELEGAFTNNWERIREFEKLTGKTERTFWRAKRSNWNKKNQHTK